MNRQHLLERDSHEFLSLEVAIVKHSPASDSAPGAAVLRRGRALKYLEVPLELLSLHVPTVCLRFDMWFVLERHKAFAHWACAEKKE
jgi:hypothetical protein